MTHVCWNIQLALESVVVQPQLFQIDKFAELLGQFSCKSENVSKHTTHVCWDIKLASNSIVADVELFQTY